MRKIYKEVCGLKSSLKKSLKYFPNKGSDSSPTANKSPYFFPSDFDFQTCSRYVVATPSKFKSIFTNKENFQQEVYQNAQVDLQDSIDVLYKKRHFKREESLKENIQKNQEFDLNKEEEYLSQQQTIRQFLNKPQKQFSQKFIQNVIASDSVPTVTEEIDNNKQETINVQQQENTIIQNTQELPEDPNY
ncbi:hypothetical protein PPERSA_01176 [Pseudocohnilembus persalinus]|uniref:Uncharacterized protein n=1 Tax=Pseudocohnilembus persalinus TaxID=266149 RepID=A0A0V0R118_PSEPJ|nr:hypothetical protein PPERSA_01176 [Pseudocohnilembus persalinus]|eukprot:KRX08246.1 hypothetical protein PPERSA_01176 [Pseudocohnilembus persalinus]